MFLTTTEYSNATEEGAQQKVSKAGYDITPLTKKRQQDLAASLTDHERWVLADVDPSTPRFRTAV